MSFASTSPPSTRREGSDCAREAKPISYGPDRNGGVRAIYIHGKEIVGAVLSSEAMELVDQVNALLRVYDAEIQHGLAMTSALGDERDSAAAEERRKIVAWLRAEVKRREAKAGSEYRDGLEDEANRILDAIEAGEHEEKKG